MVIRGDAPRSSSSRIYQRSGKGAFVLFDSSLSGILTAFMLTGNTTTAKGGIAVFFAF